MRFEYIALIAGGIGGVVFLMLLLILVWPKLFSDTDCPYDNEN